MKRRIKLPNILMGSWARTVFLLPYRVFILRRRKVGYLFENA